MRLRLNIVSHLLCLLVVFFLVTFILMEELRCYKAPLTQDVNSTLETGCKEVRKINDDAFFEVKKASAEYRNPLNTEYFNRATKIRALTDTELLWIDSLALHPEPALVDVMESHLLNLREQIFALVDYQKGVNAAFFDFCLQADKDRRISPLIRNVAQKEMQLVFANQRAKIILLEAAALKYCSIKVAGISISCWNTFQPTLNLMTIAPQVGDPVAMELCLSTYSESLDKIQVFLNDEELKMDEGTFPIRTLFPKPGNYPLNFIIKRVDFKTDSVHTLQKTFYLKVSE